jgi:hypothetical protein
MRRTALALSLTLFAGCASGYKASYVTGAVTKQFATESYNVYSEQFNDKIDECCAGDACNPESPDVITKTELDQCMGPAFENATHDKIEIAVNLYHEAAEAHTASMQIVNGSDEERKAATNKLLETAMDLLALLPEGNKLVAKLKKLTGK